MTAHSVFSPVHGFVFRGQEAAILESKQRQQVDLSDLDQIQASKRVSSSFAIAICSFQDIATSSDGLLTRKTTIWIHLHLPKAMMRNILVY